MQETFNKSYKLIRKYWMNTILYAVPMLVLYIAAEIFGGIAYFGVIFLPMVTTLMKDAGLAFIALGIVFTVLSSLFLILVSVFTSLMYNRVAYLTSRDTAIPVNMKSLSSLFEYAKENFIQLLKLAMLNILVLVCIAAVFGSAFILLFYLSIPQPINLVIAIVAGIIAVLVFLVTCAVFGTAFILFFMGSEKTGTIKLVRMGWKLFAHNIVEYVLFGLGYLVICVGCLAIGFGLSMLCLGPLYYIFAFIYSFYLSIAFFVFIEKISKQNKK